MVETLKNTAEAAWFQNFITAVIIVAGVLVGAGTYPSVMESYGPTIDILDTIVLWIFVVEIVVKMGAEGGKPWRYFLDPWNVFDFLIVAVCFMPFDSGGAAVLRLARLLRVLKLVNALPRLQVLVSALLKSIPSMGYISLLLFMLFYLYAVAATMFFSANDPIHFKTLELSMLSLFRAVTLEDWTDLMYIQMYGCANYGYDGSEALCTDSHAYPVGGALFFVSFVLSGTMVILNLFVGVIMSGMDEAQKEQKLEQVRAMRDVESDEHELAIELHELRLKLADLTDALDRVEGVASKPRNAAK